MRLLHDGDETPKIVEASAEHDFRPRRLIAMFRAMEQTQTLFCTIFPAACAGGTFDPGIMSWKAELLHVFRI